MVTSTPVDFLVNVLVFVVVLVVTLAVHRFAMYAARRAVKNGRIPEDAFNGIKVGLRLVVVLVMFIGFLALVELPQEILVSITSVSGIMIGFATTEVVAQVIAGLYIISARPFALNDLVKIGAVEGIVREIGSNYTTLQRFNGDRVKVPNKTILDSNVVKYTVKMTPELAGKLEKIHHQAEAEAARAHDQESQSAAQESISRQKRLRKLVGKASEILHQPEITRYAFEIEVEIALDPDRTLQKIHEVCQNYARVYTYEPQFIVTYLYWRTKIRFLVYCPNPYAILQNHKYFIAELTTALYGTTEEVGA